MQQKTGKIGRFDNVGTLGKGSQGTVYLARDPSLDRLVAIKVLDGEKKDLESLSQDGTPLEGRLAGRLRHPNIISVFDAGQCPDGPYLVFEYVRGQTLAQVLKRDGAFPVARALGMMDDILAALATAHAAGVVHLDLSPRNILIDAENRPRIMDFGLARYAGKRPLAGMAVGGTLRYMAPEHFNGGQLGPFTDVFALGSTFYELLSGDFAMRGDRMDSIMESVLSVSVDLERISGLEHGERLAGFLRGALESVPEGRYADAGAMRDAFRLVQNELGLQPSAGPASTGHSTVDFLLRRMQRKQDFPSISRTLSDINRLTGDDSEAPADKLAQVILRDFALSGKLLKLVNSAFYGNRSVDVTSVSQAVVLLGLEKVRMVANSLTVFGQLKGDTALLKDSMTRSFLSGLIARHLAQRVRLPGAEEAFISGMFQNLGENLVIYYFGEEYDEISDLRLEQGLDRQSAARAVLGVGLDELGAAVARVWQLPNGIIAAIRGIPAGAVPAPTDDADQLRDRAVFANELCELFGSGRSTPREEDLGELLERFAASIELPPDACLHLMDAGLEKLRRFAPVFEINVPASDYCQAVQAWLDAEKEVEKETSNP